MVHLSGATAMDKLRPPCAVVWPIRSFNPKADSVPLEGTPTVLEASDAQSMAVADLLAQAWNAEVTEVSGDQRAATHLAAAIADNFANHMFAESQDLLRQRGLPTNLMRNLVLGLTKGGLHGDSRERQTGPAVVATRPPWNDIAPSFPTTCGNCMTPSRHTLSTDTTHELQDQTQGHQTVRL